MEIHLTATECHLPYGITQCYLPPDTSEHTPPLPQPDRLVLDVSSIHGYRDAQKSKIDTACTTTFVLGWENCYRIANVANANFNFWWKGIVNLLTAVSFHPLPSFWICQSVWIHVSSSSSSFIWEHSLYKSSNTNKIKHVKTSVPLDRKAKQH